MDYVEGTMVESFQVDFNFLIKRFNFYFVTGKFDERILVNAISRNFFLNEVIETDMK